MPGGLPHNKGKPLRDGRPAWITFPPSVNHISGTWVTPFQEFTEP
jgi:hypothetical protein